VNLDGLETVLLSGTSKITELDIHMDAGGRPMMGLTPFLRALARCPSLTKLGLHCPLGCDEARLLGMAFCNIPSLQTLVLKGPTLEIDGLAELAPALYRNTSIKELNISGNGLSDIESPERLRDILCHNKTMNALDLSENIVGRTVGAVECIAEGLGSNSTLLKIDRSGCALRDSGVSTLAQSLGSRNTTLQKLKLGSNSITSSGVGVLVVAMERNSCQITDIELDGNSIGNEGASLLARALGKNVLPNLTRLSLYNCGIGDDGLIELVSALKQNTSLLHIDLRQYHGLSDRAFLALAESLPAIMVLQRVDFYWYTGLASAVPLLLAGLRKNSSLFRCHVSGCAPSAVPPTPENTARCAGGWMQEIERLGYRNRFRPLIRAPKEGLPPRSVWPHALARVATLPDVIFKVLCSKPACKEGKEAAASAVTSESCALASGSWSFSGKSQ
jgi:hypothetical protein